MKIGIITLNGHYNYGNRLQNYALQTFLLQYADEVKTIWHTPNNFLPEIWKWNWKTIIKYILNWNETRNYVLNSYVFDLIRETNIKKFTDQYIHMQYDFKLNEDLNEKYDYVIVGSDQVWNPYFGCGNAEFLEFVSPEKRIAYAASFGVEEIPNENKEKFKRWLAGVEFISVREKAGANIVKTMIGREVPVLADPTLLLKQEEWDVVAKKPSWYKSEKYILTYFLGEMPSSANKTVEKLAAENNFQIIHLMDLNHLDWYSIAPDEFIYLIKNASLVYTDSFHGAIFSILMQVPFVVCSRESLGKQNMDSRLDTLLELFSLEQRRATVSNSYCISNPLTIDFDNMKKILAQERNKATDYLKTALRIKEID